MHVAGNHLVRCSVILVILGFKNSKMSFRPSSLMAAKLHAGADDSQLAVGIHRSHFFVASSVGGLAVVVANRQDGSNQLITEDSANAFSRESASVFPSHIH